MSGLLRFPVAVLRAHHTTYGCWMGPSDGCRGSLLDEQTARAMMPEPSGTSAVPIDTDNPPEEAYDCVSGREHQYSQCPPQCHAVPHCGHPVVCHSGSPAEFMHHWKQPLIPSFILQIPFFRKQEWGSWDLLQCEKEIRGIKGTCCRIGFDRPWLSVEFASTVRSCSPMTRSSRRSQHTCYLFTY